MFINAHIQGLNLSFTNTQWGRHTHFNVIYNPNITTITTTTMTVLFKFIYEAITTQTTHNFFRNTKISFCLCLHSFIPNSSAFSPQENLSLPACNTLWLCCCLYLRKRFLCLTCLLHLFTLIYLHHMCAWCSFFSVCRLLVVDDL